MRALIAFQLLVILVAGAATVVRFPVFALVDERAHYDYVTKVADEGRLPFLGRDLISREAQALDEGVYPAPARTDPATRGLAGESYEAFQPPLYYVAAAPFYLAAGSDHRVKLRVLRGFGLLALLGAAGLLWLLAQRVAGAAAPAVFAVALTVLMWPGVVVRTVTVSNAALELVLALAAALALWEAGWGRRSARWLLAAGALVGLGLLTRTTFVVFAPVLAWAAWRSGAGRGTAVLALALPVLLLAPWLASNLDRYGALTGSAIVREMQEPFLNPTGKDYGAGDVVDRAPALFNGVLAEEWWSQFLPTWKRRLRDAVMAVLFLVPIALALRRRADAPWWLAAPLAIGVVLMAAGMLIGNWDFFYPRYAYAALPLFGVFAALALPARARLPAAGAVAAAMAGLWAYLSTVTPFVP